MAPFRPTRLFYTLPAERYRFCLAQHMGYGGNTAVLRAYGFFNEGLSMSVELQRKRSNPLLSVSLADRF